MSKNTPVDTSRDALPDRGRNALPAGEGLGGPPLQFPKHEYSDVPYSLVSELGQTPLKIEF